MKHTFNADGDAERLLQAAAAALNDKTEFINRCVRESGSRVLHLIMDERKATVVGLLQDSTTPYRAAPPPKRKAG